MIELIVESWKLRVESLLTVDWNRVQSYDIREGCWLFLTVYGRNDCLRLFTSCFGYIFFADYKFLYLIHSDCKSEWARQIGMMGGYSEESGTLRLTGGIHTLIVCLFWLFSCLQVAWGLLRSSTHSQCVFFSKNSSMWGRFFFELATKRQNDKATRTVFVSLSEMTKWKIYI